MHSIKFEFMYIATLLRRSENDQEVKAFFGHTIAQIVRTEFYGTLEFKSEGVDVVFNEAPWVLSQQQKVNPSELYIAAFHFHRKGHEEYSEYSGEFPNRVRFGDSESEIIKKMGSPLSTGGGGKSSILNRTIPLWSKYKFGDATLHFQFDANGQLELLTLSV